MIFNILNKIVCLNQNIGKWNNQRSITFFTPIDDSLQQKLEKINWIKINDYEIKCISPEILNPLNHIDNLILQNKKLIFKMYNRYYNN
jgi:hypothetical protein